MRNCHQSKGQTILEHGESVHMYFVDLYNHLVNKEPLKLEWRLPDWIYDLTTIKSLSDLDTLKTYQIYHDVGKPFCRVVDEEGKQHFPNHAQISHDIWLEYGGSEEVALLMKMDMDIHLLKAEQIEEFAKRPQAISLLLTGLAEVHSNASMFGGIDSTSFKIKWKHINKRGKQILGILNEPD